MLRLARRYRRPVRSLCVDNCQDADDDEWQRRHSTEFDCLWLCRRLPQMQLTHRSNESLTDRLASLGLDDVHEQTELKTTHEVEGHVNTRSSSTARVTSFSAYQQLIRCSYAGAH